MATSPPNAHFSPRPHPKKRRLMLFIILAIVGLGLFFIGHGFCKISKKINHLSNLYSHKNYEQITLSRSVESLERQLASTKRENENLAQKLSRHETELSRVSKQVQELYNIMTKNSQEISNIKKELETSENVIQAMMTSQVADIKRHDDLWKAIKNLEESVKKHVDADSAQVIFEAIFTKIDEITQELTQQKTKTEELAKTKGKHSEEMRGFVHLIETAMKNRAEVDDTVALVNDYGMKLEEMAKELSLQKAKTEEFSKSRMQQATEIWRTLDTLGADIKKCQKIEDASNLYADFYYKLENMENEVAQQKAKLEDFDQHRDVKLNSFDEVWRAINSLKDSVSTRVDLSNLAAFTWGINAKIEELSHQVKSQNMNAENVKEVKEKEPEKEELIEKKIPEDKVFNQEEKPDDYDTTYRRNYSKTDYRRGRTSYKRREETKNESKETKEQRTWDDLVKDINTFTKKVQGKIEQVTERVSDEVKKVQGEIEKVAERVSDEAKRAKEMVENYFE